MAEIKIRTVFDLGDVVYAVTDNLQLKGLVVRVAKSWNGGVEYEVVFDTVKGWFQSIELSKEQDMKVVVNLDLNDDDE